MAFWIYMNFSSELVLDNAIRRTADDANRNIQACYNSALYKDYGLLGYDEKTAMMEMNNTFYEQLHIAGKSILPFSNERKINIAFESNNTLSDMNVLMEQCVQQAMFNVPIEFIEQTVTYQHLIEKANLAKQQIKRHKKLLQGLKKLGQLNKKWAKSLDDLNDMDKVFSVRISSKGKIQIRMKKLDDAIEDTEKLVQKMMLEKKNINNQLSIEKNHLNAIKDKLPEGFVESSIDMLEVSTEDMMKDKLDIDIENAYGFDENMVLKHKKIIRDKWEENYGGDLPAEADEYINGLAKLYALRDCADKFEEDIKESYSDEIEDIHNQTDRTERRELKNKMYENIGDELEEWTSDVSVNADVYGKKDVDSRLEKYVDEAIDSTVDASINVESVENDNLSNQKLANKDINNLSGKDLKGNPYENMDVDIKKPIYSVALTEYIMGTFRNRLSGKSEDGEDWDFYGKMDRASLFKNAEIEYIIAGKNNEQANRAYVSGRMYITREIFNILHVYMCNKKIATADAISLLVSWQAWMVPVIKHGLLIMWASVESYDDVQKLLDGESVPVIKWSDEDWSTDIIPSSLQELVEDKVADVSSGKNADLKSPVQGINDDFYKEICELNCKNYTFYLRIYLNEISAKKRLRRMVDIIDMNYKGSKVEFDPKKLITSHKIIVSNGEEMEEFYVEYK